MTTATASWTNTITDNTTYRAALQAWVDALDTLTTKTAATGQLDASTITTSTTNSNEQRTWVTDGDDMCVRVNYSLSSQRLVVSYAIMSDFPAAASGNGSYQIGAMSLSGTQAGGGTQTAYFSVTGSQFNTAWKDDASPTTTSMFVGGWQRLSNGGYFMVNSATAGSSVSGLSSGYAWSAPGSVSPTTGGSTSWPYYGAKGDVSGNVEFYRWAVRPANGVAVEFPSNICAISGGALTPWTTVTVGSDIYLPTPCGNSAALQLAMRYV